VLEIEYGEEDVNCFTDMLRTSTPAATLHQSTGGRPECSRRFRDVIEPAGHGHELRLGMMDPGRPWGGYGLLPAQDPAGVTDSERGFMAALSSRLARNLRRTIAAQSPTPYAQPDHHPGLLLLNPNGDVDTMTAGFLESVDGLVDVGSVLESRLPCTIHALIARTSAMP